MLIEGLVYLQSLPRTPLRFRRYLGQAVGLWARGRRQAQAWAPHLDRCRGTIESSIDSIGQHRTVAILGSGPCFDVPLEALAARFERVLLIDRAQLSTLRPRLAGLTNVECVWRDLAPAGDAAPLRFLGDISGLDWVVSINLLSQLARAAGDGEEAATIDAHLTGLESLSCRVSLLTDRSYRALDRTGAILEQFDLLYGRPMPTADSTWPWEVAPFGEESSKTRRLHDVAAYPDWHASTSGGTGQNGFIR